MPGKSYGSVSVFFPKMSRERVVEHISRKVHDLQAHLPIRRLVLFGSYARNEHTVASDIDVLVVYAGPPKSGAFSTVKRALDLPRLEPHVYTIDEYEKVSDTVEAMLAKGSVDIAHVHPKETAH